MTNAELFIMAADPATSRDAFLNCITLSAPDAPGCIDLDAEKARLSPHLGAGAPVHEGADLPYRSVPKCLCKRRWNADTYCAGLVWRKENLPCICPFLLAEHYQLL